MGARVVPNGTREASSMQDGLRLDFFSPSKPVEASHFQAEHPGTRVIRPGSSTCLIFTAHGGLVVEDGRVEQELQANAALLIEPRGAAPVRLTNRGEADFYLLRFRWALGKGAHTGQVLQVPPHATVLRPARLTHLLRMYIEKARGESGSTTLNPQTARNAEYRSNGKMLASARGSVSTAHGRGVPVRGVSRTSELMLHHLLVLALCELARSPQDGMLMPAREPGLASIASRVDAFVAAHYHETISTPDIAAELRYNPDYLERAYRQERGMSIREAIHTRRINEARAQLLLLRQQGVAQIAALCGYTDAGYFRRLFKRATHMTPHGYRAVHAELLPDDSARAAEKALHP